MRTEEEYAAMRAEIAEVDRQRALAEQAQLDAMNAPLVAFMASPELAVVRDRLRALCAQFRDDDRIYEHVRALSDITARLEDELRFRNLMSAQPAAVA